MVGGSNGVDFNDSVKARFGTGNDLEVYHDGSNTQIVNNTGAFNIRGDSVYISSQDNSESLAHFIKDGAVKLHHDNTLMIETTADGVGIPDDKKLEFGAGDDLQIWHNSSSGESIIQENGSNRLDIRASNLIFNNAANNKTYINCTDGGAVEISHNGSKKWETNASGCQITGTVSAGTASLSTCLSTNATIGGVSIGSNNVSCSGTVSCGTLTSSGNVTAYSDERLKDSIKTIDNALDKVSKMRGVTFQRKDTRRKDSGVIAQEIEKVAPELVIDGELSLIHI